MSRISPGTMTAAIFAILIGLVGAYSVRQYLNQPPPPEAVVEVEEEVEPPAPDLVYVPTAAREIIAGKSLTINDIVIHKFTREEFRDSDFSEMSFMPDPQQIVGRTLRNPLVKDSVFHPTDFYADGEGPGVAELLKPGLRAVTVGIKNIGAVEGFARPGSLVDVLYRADADDETPEVTMTLLERVEVLAVGRAAVPGQTVTVGTGQSSQDGSITLAVTPHQAKALKVVEGHGELTLALRHPDDVGENLVPVKLDEKDLTTVAVGDETGAVGDEKMTLERLVGRKPAKLKKKIRELVVFRGSARETITFETVEKVVVPKNRFGGLINTPIAGNPRPKKSVEKPGDKTTLKSDGGAQDSPSGSTTSPAAVAGKDDGGS